MLLIQCKQPPAIENSRSLVCAELNEIKYVKFNNVSLHAVQKKLYYLTYIWTGKRDR